MPRPIATWNTARGAWEKPQGGDPLFRLCEHSELFSEIWPTSGSMRSGSCYPPPPSGHPTSASGASSSRGQLTVHPELTGGRLQQTPTSQLGVNGGSQHPDKRKSGGHGPTLADEVENLLPAPMASDTGTPGRRASEDFRPPLSEVLLPLLPTPTVADSRGTRNATAGRSDPNSAHHDGTTLCDAIRLLPTPRTSDTNGIGPHGTGGPDLRTVVSEMSRPSPGALGATPRATDGTKGGPNQRGSSGDLMLPSAVAHLPTPRARDWKRGGKDGLEQALLPTPTVTQYGGNQSPTPGASVRPSLNSLASGGSLPPTPTAADVDRASLTMPRGNPTSRGAITNPPSDVGKPSSDGQLPGQLTIEDA